MLDTSGVGVDREFHLTKSVCAQVSEEHIKKKATKRGVSKDFAWGIGRFIIGIL